MISLQPKVSSTSVSSFSLSLPAVRIRTKQADLSCRKGASPTPIQGFNLGIGRSVPNIQVGDFTSLGQKTKGTITITPPDGDGAWLTRQEAKAAEDRWGWKLGSEWDFWDSEGKGGCIWAGHGV